MMDIRFSPFWLPQVSAPLIYILNKLKEEEIPFKILKVHPNELNPSQGIIFLDKVSKLSSDNIKPIWGSNGNMILDGHHRYASALSHDKPIKFIKILLNPKDAARILNKIQDIFTYERQLDIEEVVNQNQINAMNDKDSGVSTSEFLTTLENLKNDDEIIEDNSIEIVGKQPKKLTAYRKGKIKENSKVGNFFSVKPVDGYIKYNIEFDNILDTDEMNLIYHKDNNPVFILAKNWFPNLDFDFISKKIGINKNSLINRAVAEKAKNMNFDGIKYGDIMIQGLN